VAAPGSLTTRGESPPPPAAGPRYVPPSKRVPTCFGGHVPSPPPPHTPPLDLDGLRASPFWEGVPGEVREFLGACWLLPSPTHLPTPDRLPSRLHLLRRFLPRWAVHLISYGKDLPVRKVPPTPSHVKTGVEAVGLDSTVRQYIQAGVLTVVEDTDQPVLSHFGVAKSSGGQRLVTNFKPFNRELVTPPPWFKLPTTDDVGATILPHSLLGVVDVEDAFNHLRLSKVSSKLCTIVHRFSDAPDVPVRLQWQSMGFGLSWTPVTWTRLLRCLLQIVMPCFSHVILDYVDDMLLVVPPGPCHAERAHWEWSLLIHSLRGMGLAVNVDKCRPPATRATYLGYDWDTVSMDRRLPERKRLSALTSLKTMLRRATVRLSDVQRVQGVLRHLSSAVELSLLRLRSLQHFLREIALEDGDPHSRKSWKLTPEIRADLKWWVEVLSSSPRPVPLTRAAVLPLSQTAATVTTDSSTKGWGAVLHLPQESQRCLTQTRAQAELEPEPTEVAQGFWTQEWIQCHITMKELKAACMALNMWSAKHPHVRDWHLRVDNRAAMFYLMGLQGGRVPSLHKLVLPLHTAMRERGQFLEVSWLPSEANHLADTLSRQRGDRSDVRLLWKWMEKGLAALQLPLPDVDLTATRANKRARLWVSRLPELGCLYVNILKCPPELLRGLNCWTNPPWRLLPRLVQWLRSAKHRLQGAGGSLVVCAPNWHVNAWRAPLDHLAVARVTLPRHTSLFADCWGKNIKSPPPWETCLWRLW
jgi:hypothetical protein